MKKAEFIAEATRVMRAREKALEIWEEINKAQQRRSLASYIRRWKGEKGSGGDNAQKTS